MAGVLKNGFYSNMLKGLSGLRVLKLGQSVNLSLAGLQEPNIKGTLNKWQAVGNGTIDNPSGKNLLTSSQLSSMYSSTQGPLETYVLAKDQAEIHSHDSNIIAGPNQKWDPSDNYIGLTDTGDPLNVNDPNLKITGNVDTNTPGSYTITYTYTSPDNPLDVFVSVCTVTVIASQASINGKDQTIIAGPSQKWDPKDGFDGATDANGDPVDFKDITVGGDTVNPNKPGSYNVTYSYVDAYGNEVSKIVVVTVIASQASIDGHDSTVDQGSKWDPKNNFDGATDANGDPVNFNDVAVTGDVNTNKAGTYKVTYTYTDGYGNVVSKTITVTVKEDNDGSKPTDPSKPGNPSTPNKPSNPSQPTNPGEVVNPAQPTGNETVDNAGVSKLGNGDTVLNDKDTIKNDNTKTEPTTNNKLTKQEVDKGTLPQTGDDVSKSSTLTITGAVILGAIGLIGLGLRRRKGQK